MYTDKTCTMENSIHRTIISLSSLVYRFIIICYIDVVYTCAPCVHAQQKILAESKPLLMPQSEQMFGWRFMCERRISWIRPIAKYTLTHTENDRDRRNESESVGVYANIDDPVSVLWMCSFNGNESERDANIRIKSINYFWH